MIQTRIATLALSALFAALLSGCSISRDLTLEDGETRRGGFRTIDGNIDIGANARTGSAKTIDGDIVVGASSRTKTLATIDGDIDLGSSVVVKGSLNTIDGYIRIEPGCEVHKNVRTIDGDISIADSLIQGDIRTTAGSIRLVGSTVKGTIIVEKARERRDALSTVEIGPNCDVRSIVIKESPSKVRLLVHVAAEIESIEGAEPEYYGASE